jgi:hypothetical protein
MKKICLHEISTPLTDKEMKLVTGGTGPFRVDCSYWNGHLIDQCGGPCVGGDGMLGTCGAVHGYCMCATVSIGSNPSIT